MIVRYVSAIFIIFDCIINKNYEKKNKPGG